MSDTSHMLAVQDAVVKWLYDWKDRFGKNWFVGIEILAADRGNITAKITEALSKQNLVVVVEIIEVDVEASPIKITGRISIIENPTVNRARKDFNGKTAPLVGEKILEAFNPRQSKERPVEVGKLSLLENDGPLLSYQVRCVTSADWIKH